VLSRTFCAERQCLITEYTVAVSDYLKAVSAQGKSAADGNWFAFFAVEDEIHATRQRKDEAKYVFLKHLDTHGCCPTIGLSRHAG
jgi:hypothetical protein